MKIRILIALLLFTLSSPTVFAIEADNTKSDVALATVWAVGKFTQGAYVKSGIYASPVYNDFNSFGEFEGGWRFTRHFGFGGNLRAGLMENVELDSNIIMFSLVAAWREKLPSGRPFNIDIKVGSMDLTRGEESYLFVEPGIHFLHRAGKFGRNKMTWSLGLSYRHVENESVTISGKNSLDSLGINLDLVFGRY